nr:retrovirus-related Pol polyprotein from transposon TNT 1-94 [Tanacetum cinerariifolium]
SDKIRGESKKYFNDGIPNEHQLKFNSIKDAKKLLEAVEKRFGGNAATKKTQWNLLKQQYENFTALRSVMLDQTMERLQKLNKADLDTMSMYYLYNNLKVYEPEVKGKSSSSLSTQNMAFVSSLNNNTSSTNRAVNTTQAFYNAHEVSTTSTKVNADYSTNINNLSDVFIGSFFASQPNSPQLVHEDLEQIYLDDMEEMDLRWQMDMLTMRARREYRAPRNQDNKHKERSRRSVPIETSTFITLVSCDGLGGYDLSDHAYEGLNYALMAFSSSNSDSEVSNDSSCSKSCLETVKLLKSKNDQLLKDLKKSDLMVLDEFVNKHVVENYKAMSSEEEPKIQVSDGLGPQKKLIFLPNVQGNPQMDLQDRGVIDSGCTSHMTRNMSYLIDYEEIDRGYVPFGENPKGGKITGKCTIKTRGLPSKLFENDQTCVACQKGKQHIASCKPKIENSINLPLHLLHMDLFGPTFVKILKKKLYCLVLIDNYSRFTWVFFLATKDETSGILKSFITRIENLVDHKVKVIRCDNGTEFKNREMNQFCEMNGIRRQFSVARTPQKNGVAERRNRILIEADRTMLAESKLPTNFWAEVVNTACNVQNKVFIVKPHNKTPYELFYCKTLTLSFKIPFRCPFTILNTIDHLGKFDGMADKGFFIGYSLNSKTFRVFNSRTKIAEENLHIRFSESTPNVVGTQFNGSVDPRSFNDDRSKPSSDDRKKVEKDLRIENECNDHDREDNVNNTNNVNTVSLTVNTAGTNRVNKKGYSTKWVFRNKKDKMGIVIRNKARLVAQGYTQEERIDYDEVFATVATIEAIRLFLDYASFKDFVVYQMDIKSAFLYRKIEEEVTNIKEKDKIKVKTGQNQARNGKRGKVNQVKAKVKVKSSQNRARIWKERKKPKPKA